MAHLDTVTITVQAKDENNNNIDIPDETLLDFSLDANGELLGNLIDSYGLQAKSLGNIPYGDANAGKVKYVANGEEPDSSPQVFVFVKQSNDTTKMGSGSVVVKESVVIKVQVVDRELQPLGDLDNKDNPNYNRDGPDRRKKIIDFSKVKKTTVTIEVSDKRNNPIPNYSFTINALTRQKSGGHDHTANRPRGKFITSAGDTLASLQGTTGNDGRASYTYLSSGIGGIDSIFVRGKTDKDTASTIIMLTMGDFQLLEGGEHYELIGATTTHSVNHYGIAKTIEKLIALADLAYADSLYVLQYNDMSLINGGPFDISSNHFWDTPHQTHREGRNVDMRPWSADVRRRTLDIRYIERLVVRVLRGQFKEEFKNQPNHHFHLTF